MIFNTEKKIEIYFLTNANLMFYFFGGHSKFSNGATEAKDILLKNMAYVFTNICIGCCGS